MLSANIFSPGPEHNILSETQIQFSKEFNIKQYIGLVPTSVLEMIRWADGEITTNFNDFVYAFIF